MKIAMISSNEHTVPPPENVIIASQYMASLLAQGLAKKGHEVYFIVGQGSKIPTYKVFSNTKPFFEIFNYKKMKSTIDPYLIGKLIVPFEIDLHLTLLDFLKENSVDLVHFHTISIYNGLPFSSRIKVPSIFSLHGTVHPLELEIMKVFNHPKLFYISLSNNQRQGYPGINFASTVYNGIPLDDYSYQNVGGNNMVFAGRLVKEKGVDEAILVAAKLKRELRITGEIRVRQRDYYEQIIQLIKNNSRYVRLFGFTNHALINSFFGSGKLFLCPTKWEEPFGLVLIEAMACGTPVIAYARGAIPEIVKDGETGFIVNSSDQDIRGNWIVKKTGFDGLCEAVEKIYAMPENQYRQMRKNCRAHVEKNFTVEIMVDQYEEVYKKILEKS